MSSEFLSLPLPNTASQALPAEIAKPAANLTSCIADPVGDPDFVHVHLHAALGNHMNDVDDAEGAATQGAENGHGGDGPEDEFEVKVGADVLLVVSFADRHGEHGVCDHPGYHHVRAHGAVVIFLLLSFTDAFFRDFEAIAKVA